MSIALRGGGAQELLPIGQRLRDALHRDAQVRLHLTANALQEAGITLVVTGVQDLDEAYSIAIGPAGVVVEAGAPTTSASRR